MNSTILDSCWFDAYTRNLREWNCACESVWLLSNLMNRAPSPGIAVPWPSDPALTTPLGMIPCSLRSHLRWSIVGVSEVIWWYYCFIPYINCGHQLMYICSTCTYCQRFFQGHSYLCIAVQRTRIPHKWFQINTQLYPQWAGCMSTVFIQ